MTESEVAVLNERIDGLERYFESRIISICTATDRATSTLDKRLEGMNEFRSSLSDQNKTFITRIEYDSLMRDIRSDIRDLREARAELRGKATQMSMYWAMAVGVIGLIMSGVSIVAQLVGR